MNIAAILGAVALQISLGFSRVGARMLTATLRMTKQVHLHALAGPTIGLCSAHEEADTSSSL